MWAATCLLALSCFTAQAVAISVISTRVEGLSQPIGISNTTPRLAWILSSTTRNNSQVAYQIQVSTSPGFAISDLWDSGKISSADSFATYAGASLLSRQSAWWRIRAWGSAGDESSWGPVQLFEIGLLKSSDWTASWIGNTQYKTGVNALPYFATTFSVSCPVTKGRLYLYGLGQHHAALNGDSVDNSVLEPGYSVYDKTLFYSTYNISTAIKQGNNFLAVELGKGTYDSENGLWGRYARYTNSPRQLQFIAQLEYTCLNGIVVTVPSNITWKTTVAGPRLESAWYGGEEYNAQSEVAGWPTSTTDISKWQSANLTTPAKGTLTGRLTPPMKIVQTIKPVSVKSVSGTWVFDFGVNFAGWFNMTMNLPAGTRVVAWPTERLTSSGLEDQSGSGRPTFDGYTSNGKVGYWSPKFMYHGFRYLQVNLTNTPTTDSVVGYAIRSGTDTIGSVSTSSTLFNSIHSIIDRAIQSNLFSVMTDCPHREKLGWLEETHLVIDPVMFTYDMESHLKVEVKQMVDQQQSTGLISSTAPEYVQMAGDYEIDPNWGTTMIILPLKHYLNYGDITILKDNYSAMQAYMTYLASRAGTNYTIPTSLGDWTATDGSTSHILTASFGYQQAAAAMASIARYLGKTSDVQTYTTLSTNIISAVNKANYNSSCSCYGSSQGSNALALDMGAASSSTFSKVLSNLVSSIKSTGHLTVGEIAHPSLIRILQSNGHNDLLYTLMSSTSYPSYGYEVAQGATSLWESWAGGAGYSLNHFMFGYGDNWLRALSGLNRAESSIAWSNITYSPIVVGSLTSAIANHTTVRGLASAAWKLAGSTLTYDVVVPVGSIGNIVLNYTSITESGGAIKVGSNGIISLNASGGVTTVVVGSGSYSFIAS